MKRWIVLSSLAWSLALVAPKAPAQPLSGDANGPAAATPPVPLAPPASTSVGPVSVPRSTAHQFQSLIVDDVYEVRVSVPEDYDLDAKPRPVIYALDGQWNFTLLSDIAGKLAWEGSIPDPIVVGITWAGSSFQPGAERGRDFTPEVTPLVAGSGGGASFLRVLETEIFPLVESGYRASSERVLTGASLGGLFVSYALLERPDLFTGYIASSAATNLAPEYFARRLEEISPRLLRDERAFFSVGALYDNDAEVRSFVDSLEGVVGKTSKIALDVVPGVGHTGNEAFAYIKGLLHVFERPRLPLSERFLERYEGDYLDSNAPTAPELTIIASGRGELQVLQNGQPWPEVFYAASRTHFYAQGTDIDLTFYRTDAGELAFDLNLFRNHSQQVRR